MDDSWNDKTGKPKWRIWDNVKSEFTFSVYSDYEAAKTVADKKNDVKSN
jgi:hypothetical protein